MTDPRDLGLHRQHRAFRGRRRGTDSWLSDWCITNLESRNGCMYLAAGVGQAIRGFRADIVLIDDPIRSRAEAESEVGRNSLWEFFHSDLLPRLTPRGGAVLIATAYHEMDVMMRLEREHSDLWRVVRLPALCEKIAASRSCEGSSDPTECRAADVARPTPIVHAPRHRADRNERRAVPRC